jgi:hypothetical protein
MLLKLHPFAIVLLSITLAACGSDSGSLPVDSGADRMLTDVSDHEGPSTGELGVDLTTKWTLTDGGECIGPETGPCTLDEHPCAGKTACRSCNAALGLWKIMPVWTCDCASRAVNGSMGLYWMCPSQPVCTLDRSTFPDTFLDNQCTVPAVIDAGID